MKNWLRKGLLLIMSTGLASAVQAVDSTDQITSLTQSDYFTIFLAGIIFINVFLVLLYRIFRGDRIAKTRSSAFTILGTIVAFLMVGVGSILIIIDILVLIYIIGGILDFRSAYYFLQNFFPGNITLGIIIAGGTGLLMFLIGFYLIILIHGTKFIDTRGMPTISGAISKGQDTKEELEPLNPTLTFRVIRRDDDKPAPDVKVVLKQRQGIKFHIKFTDFNGEVKFTNIEGYAYDYYAYVEGDENRQVFRVLQK
jgi:hypothetical protein